MSLQYEKETEPLGETSEQNEEVQRTAAVFPVYTVILIVCLAAVLICQTVVDGLEAIIFGGEKSTLLAGFVKPFFVEGQYWRILTGGALHGGVVHLLFNGYALFVLGRLIETLSNCAHLAIVFLLSIIGGGVLSLIFMPDGVSVGASGGILGFLGYLTVYGFKRKELLPGEFLKNMLFNVGFIAFVGVFVMSRVDNFAHLGGFLTGAVYGLLQIPRDVYKDPREIGKTTEIIGLTALGIFIAASVFSIFVLLEFV
jgi:membrane associated rhomboid family serine protease